jgi:hypothetical protein
MQTPSVLGYNANIEFIKIEIILFNLEHILHE